MYLTVSYCPQHLLANYLYAGMRLLQDFITPSEMISPSTDNVAPRLSVIFSVENVWKLRKLRPWRLLGYKEVHNDG